MGMESKKDSIDLGLFKKSPGKPERSSIEFTHLMLLSRSVVIISISSS